MEIMIADDHPLYIEGLKNFLADDFEVVGVVHNGEEVIKEAVAKEPDLILMDIKMPVIDGIEATKKIKQKLPDIQIIILTSFEEEDSLLTAVQAGASGYLLKSLDGAQLVRDLKEIEAGKNPFAPGLEKLLLKEICNQEKKDIRTKIEQMLTKRQLEVVELLVEGLTYQEIADELYLTERTIKYHMKKIKEKLGKKTRREVMKYVKKFELK
ncbi:MAG: response regulator [Bacillota bacterium]